MKQNYTIERGSLDGIEAFLRVAERRSFRQAAGDLGVSPSAISQSIRALEGRIGVPLFTRTTRSVGLTEAGARLWDRARPAFEALIAASEAARGLGERPSGLLRLAVPRGVVPLILEQVLAPFCQTYPDVTLELSASEELVDLAKDGFDAGVRMGQFIAQDMVTVRLTPPFRLIMVASPLYLARIGRPKQAGDLVGHACLRIRRSNGTVGDWRLLADGRSADMAVNGPMIANDFPTIVGAALAGVGLAQVPEPIAHPYLMNGALEEVLPGRAPKIPGLFLYFSERRQVLPKLRAFIEHVRAHPVNVPGI